MADVPHRPDLKPRDTQNTNILQNYLSGLQLCISEISNQDIEGIADILFEAYQNNRRIFIFGNGGSAATASHMVCDLRKGTALPGKPRLKVTSLTDNIPLFTAIANDLNYDSVFVEQLISQVEKGDVAIGISASGNSPNVLKAIQYASEQGATTIGFTAFGGGKLKDMADKSINLSTRDFGQAEDIHLSLGHILKELIKAKIKSDAL
jgi:D-sedoheptulose 7-phosphate isomerase